MHANAMLKTVHPVGTVMLQLDTCCVIVQSGKHITFSDIREFWIVNTFKSFIPPCLKYKAHWPRWSFCSTKWQSDLFLLQPVPQALLLPLALPEGLGRWGPLLLDNWPNTLCLVINPHGREVLLNLCLWIFLGNTVLWLGIKTRIWRKLGCNEK